MRIVVDVMGGDHGCGVVLDGVKLALANIPQITELHVVGREPEIQAALAKNGCRDPRLRIVHASEVLTMEDKPVVGLRKKKDCSIARAVEMLKAGKGDALVSPGNTGGVVTASTLRLRTIEHVDRPAIATVIPTPHNDFVLLDAGANVECKPHHLLDFAIMGSVYSREILGCKKPRVGILSVGTEPTKGNDLTLAAFQLCRQVDLNFLGNVEGHDLFAGHVDVVVCDGFTGNIVLKTCESLASAMFGWLRRELTSNLQRQLGAALSKGAFRTIKRRMDPENFGGAPLLGLNGNVIIAHGGAREKSIQLAIQQGVDAIKNQINQVIHREVTQAKARLASTPAQPPAPATA
ncbi:phosphate acyltransferase [Verrucomicrobiota bacterium]|nr:phosphate acyltransferase [Verrucomicrobiota bacterium]